MTSIASMSSSASGIEAMACAMASSMSDRGRGLPRTAQAATWPTAVTRARARPGAAGSGAIATGACATGSGANSGSSSFRGFLLCGVEVGLRILFGRRLGADTTSVSESGASWASTSGLGSLRNPAANWCSRRRMSSAAAMKAAACSSVPPTAIAHAAACAPARGPFRTTQP